MNKICMFCNQKIKGTKLTSSAKKLTKKQVNKRKKKDEEEQAYFDRHKHDRKWLAENHWFNL